MSSSADGVFGVQDDVREIVEQDLSRVEQADRQPEETPAQKSWVERNLRFVAGGVVLFFVVLIVVALLVRSSGKSSAERAADAQRRAQMANEERQAGAFRSDLAALQAEVQRLQEVLRTQAERLERVPGSQDVLALDHKASEAIRQVTAISQEMQHLRRVVADQEPLDNEMLINTDAEIVSVGNGLARIRDRNGVERTLRRGDTWSGLRVMSIRADRRQVGLSDGSVIL